MSQSKKKNPTEDLMESLMAELNLSDSGETPAEDDATTIQPDNPEDHLELGEKSDFGLLDFGENVEEEISSNTGFEIKLAPTSEPQEVVIETHTQPQEPELVLEVPSEPEPVVAEPPAFESNDEKTVALALVRNNDEYAEGDRTVAVAGYSNRRQAVDNDVKISVGQSGSGYGGWGSTESHLAQAENLKIAQGKILDLEKENERLRHQNEELVSASEIIKERSDLLTAQIYEYKNDREGLENSFKNEMALLKSQLNRKDAELQKAQMKIEELESRLKFDMKKIRIRERELENRLELIRAEKNALVRNKDEQILDARRKMDQLQLEVDSFRQKCVELNRALETNQDSFKRTTRALRLAMANLELQEENKTPIKKVD